ncbi:MAG TPA: M23 family metallopeptidase [Acidimicrobiales bacterium]|nr:M23 family metallopeptidase [Acidimicrobiales bacterium]
MTQHSDAATGGPLQPVPQSVEDAAEKGMPRVLCYPHALPWKGPAPPASDLHETAGIPGNWALDFMAHGGTTILAPEDCTVTRLSGHDPKEGDLGAAGIFGWNTYLETHDGLLYFLTHQGSRAVHVGQKVKLGEIIGVVGHWPNDEPRSHTHMGVTHPDGVKASQVAICKVAEAGRVKGFK